MRILHLSDTHSKHHLLKNFPKADSYYSFGRCFFCRFGEDENYGFYGMFGGIAFTNTKYLLQAITMYCLFEQILTDYPKIVFLFV